VTLSHLHLVLNHVPTVGSAIALGLLLLALLRRNEHLKIAGLEVLFVIAIVTLPAYISGAGAQRELRDRPDVSVTAIRVHQDVALAGFTVTEFAGFVAWIALWQFRRAGRAARGLVPAVMLLLVVALAIMGRAATLGGEIRHPEMLGAVAADAAAPVLNTVEPADGSSPYVATAISEFLVNSRWAWPAAETVHFLGLSLSIGVLLAVNLRILGVMPRVPFADVHRLLPWGMLGFGVNLITGMLFVVAQPAQYINNEPFYWKVVLLMFTGGNFLYLTVFTKAWAADGLRANLADKAMAISSIVAWLGVLYAGRMLPYLGNAF
jgi:hypothetical protein